LDVLRQYAQAAYVSVDEQIAMFSDDDLATPSDMTPVGLGQ
jgi:hypothetical protein